MLKSAHGPEHGEILLTFCGHLAVVITTSQTLSLNYECKAQSDVCVLATQVFSDSIVNTDTHSLVLGVHCCRDAQAKIPAR